MIYNYNGKYVVLASEVFQKINSYRQTSPTDYEAGGVLLGRIFSDVISIDGISEPSSEDKSGRHYFFRNVKKAQRIVNDAWEKSNGEQIYLGEWHTHPESRPVPSADDRLLIKNMHNHTKMEIDFLFMFILGQSNHFISVLDKEGGFRELHKPDLTNKVMIDIYYEGGNVIGFQSVGYIDHAKYGFDIFNASLSVILFGTINSILSLCSVDYYILQNGQGYLKFLLLESGNEMKFQNASILFESMKVQLDMIKETIEQNTKCTIEIHEN